MIDVSHIMNGEDKHVDAANRIMFLWYRKRKNK